MGTKTALKTQQSTVDSCRTDEIDTSEIHEVALRSISLGAKGKDPYKLESREMLANIWRLNVGPARRVWDEFSSKGQRTGEGMQRSVGSESTYP
jgi:hypothetical protein